MFFQKSRNLTLEHGTKFVICFLEVYITIFFFYALYIASAWAITFGRMEDYKAIKWLQKIQQCIYISYFNLMLNSKDVLMLFTFRWLRNNRNDAQSHVHYVMFVSRMTYLNAYHGENIRHNASLELFLIVCSPFVHD